MNSALSCFPRGYGSSLTCPASFRQSSDCSINSYFLVSKALGHSFVEIKCDPIGLNVVKGFYQDDPSLTTLASTANLIFGVTSFIAAGVRIFTDAKAAHMMDPSKPRNLAGQIRLNRPTVIAITAFVFSFFFPRNSFCTEGKIIDDSDYLNFCKRIGDCLSSSRKINPNQAAKAADYIEGVETSSSSGLGIGYCPFSNNCIDFVIDTMQSAGATDFVQNIKALNSSTSSRHVKSIAWRYLLFKSWWNS